MDINKKGDHDRTPLHVAVEQGRAETTQFLILEGANINESALVHLQKFKQNDVQHKSAFIKYADVIQYLLENLTKDPNSKSVKAVFMLLSNFVATETLNSKQANLYATYIHAPLFNSKWLTDEEKAQIPIPKSIEEDTDNEGYRPRSFLRNSN